ncbi:hypothetical protein BASA81_013248 [Batrachochytrium salamandrivorans]|nr:hypothetical protein BASA81_013248 [Batrachochytrium salamandrivorans]
MKRSSAQEAKGGPTPEAKRFEMEKNLQDKDRLMERLGDFYDEMQGELETLIQMEQDHVRRRYLGMFESLLVQTEVQLVLDRLSDRAKVDEFEFLVKEWEDKEGRIKQDLVRLQRMLLGDFGDQQDQEERDEE